MARIFVGLVVMVSGLMGTGCRQQDPLVYDAYAQVRPQSWNKVQVRETLGEPSAVFDDRWIYERPEKHVTVMIDFDEQDRVSRKQWIDGRTGEWQDSEP